MAPRLRKVAQVLWFLLICQNVIVLTALLVNSNYTVWITEPFIPKWYYIAVCVLMLINCVILYLGIFRFQYNLLHAFVLVMVLIHHFPVIMLIIDAVDMGSDGKAPRSTIALINEPTFLLTMLLPLMWISYWLATTITIYKLWYRLKEFYNMPDYMRSSNRLMSMSRTNFSVIKMRQKRMSMAHQTPATSQGRRTRR